MKSLDLFFSAVKKSIPYLILIILLSTRMLNTTAVVTAQDRNIRDILSIISISLLIYFEKDNLDLFHIKGKDIKLFILSNIFFQIFLFSNLYLINLGCGIFVLWVYIKWIKPQEKSISGGWIIVSVSLGMLLPFIFNWIDINIFRESTQDLPIPGLLTGIIYLMRTLASTVIIEEYTFRSALWGVCRKMNFKEPVILLIQAFVFWISHIHYLGQANYMFWFIIPIISLILGFVVLKYRSITPAVTIHALFNTVLLYVR